MSVCFDPFVPSVCFMLKGDVRARACAGCDLGTVLLACLDPGKCFDMREYDACSHELMIRWAR